MGAALLLGYYWDSLSSADRAVAAVIGAATAGYTLARHRKHLLWVVGDSVSWWAMAFVTAKGLHRALTAQTADELSSARAAAEEAEEDGYVHGWLSEAELAVERLELIDRALIELGDRLDPALGRTIRDDCKEATTWLRRAVQGPS
jgi:hypothetical protein